MLEQQSDLGFGTEYEKVVFSGILSRISKKYGINSYLNFPKNNLLGLTDGMMGSLVETAEGPDLLWNFCEFENRKDTQQFFSDLTIFKPKHLLIVTQNRLNPGTLLHYLYHISLRKTWDHGHLAMMTVSRIQEYSKVQKNYEILEVGTFDAPWFILDVYEVGRYLRKIIPVYSGSKSAIKSSLFESSPKVIKNWASHHNYILLRLNAGVK
jgi:hypothetical protein